MALLLSLWVVFAGAAPWNPSAIADRSTIELLTVGPEEGEHWSTVWFVVVEGDMYVRLGARAATRIENNTTAPVLRLRAEGVESRPIRYEEAPEMIGPVGRRIGR